MRQPSFKIINISVKFTGNNFCAFFFFKVQTELLTFSQVWLENNIHFEYRCWFCCNYVRTTAEADNHNGGKIYIYDHRSCLNWNFHYCTKYTSVENTPISINLKGVCIPVVLCVVVHHK